MPADILGGGGGKVEITKNRTKINNFLTGTLFF